MVGVASLVLSSIALAYAAGPNLTTSWRVASKDAQGDTNELALTVTVEPGWHVNANDPDKPYVIPTTLEIDPPVGTTIVSIRYPDPVVRSLAFAPGPPLRLYEGTFTIGVRVAGGVPTHFDAKLGYQACNDDTCLPPRTLAVPFEGKTAVGSK